MSEFTKSKYSIFVTVFIGLIILTFMFTGYQSFDGGAGGVSNVGSVGGVPIKVEEYQQEYNRQIEFYKQIMGGELSAKQLEAMKVKDMTIKNIVQRKLLVKFAKDLGTFPSEEEVKAEIKSLPYFLTNGQFDITRYKAILGSNRLTPLEFEHDVIDQLRMKKVQELTANFPLSKGYLDDMNKFRSEKVNAQIVQISKNSLRQFIDVSDAEVTKFLAEPTNAKRVEAMFNEQKSSLDKDEEVTAKHILLLTDGKNDAEVKTKIEKIAKEVTPANFSAKANQYTEDPSGKGKGGDLGSFGKGRMVPEFESVAFSQRPGTVSAPVKTSYGYHIIFVEKKSEAVKAKLDDHKNKFARDIVQKNKVEDLKNLTVSIANQMRKALESGNTAEAKALAGKYKLQFSESSVNRLDGAGSQTYLSADNMKTIFSSDLTKPQFHSFDDGANMTMIRTTPGAVVADLNEQAKIASDDASLKNALAKKMMDDIMKKLEANTKVKINESVLRM